MLTKSPFCKNQRINDFKEIVKYTNGSIIFCDTSFFLLPGINISVKIGKIFFKLHKKVL